MLIARTSEEVSMKNAGRSGGSGRAAREELGTSATIRYDRSSGAVPGGVGRALVSVAKVVLVATVTSVPPGGIVPTAMVVMFGRKTFARKVISLWPPKASVTVTSTTKLASAV